MRIEVITRHLENDTMIRELIEEKVGRALHRVESRIRSVVVRMEDETRDSKRFDGACRIEVDLDPRGHVHISASANSPVECVMEAVRKMEHAVMHDIDRHRRASQIRHRGTQRQFIESLANAKADEGD